MSCADEDPIARWSTNDVPQAERLEYFASAVSQAIIPYSISNADPARFRADLRATQLEGLGVCRVRASPHTFIRDSSEFARTRAHVFNIGLTMDGGWTGEHRGSSHRFSPREMLIYDSSYPVCCDVRDAFSGLNVAVPEAWLRRWVPNPSVLIGRRIGSESPWGCLLSSYLVQLSPEFIAAAPLPMAVLADQVGSLLALIASGFRGNPTADYSPAVRSLHERVLDCILERCTEPQLTAADVSASLNISLRTLHRTLAAAQDTFGARLIAARTEAAERMLKSALFDRVTTAEIARRAGFSSTSHFIRVIRHRTGQTPSQLRRESGR